MYARFGRTEDAWKMFDELPFRGCFSYHSLILCFGLSGFHEEVLLAYGQMRHLGHSPNSVCVAQVLLACGELGYLAKGMWIHDYVSSSGFSSVLVDNSLISMYTKVGRLDIARQVFDNMSNRDLVSWNSMILGYARGKDWVEAFNIFASMKFQSCVPNHVTFLGLILACGQAGDLRFGESIHGHLIRVGTLSDLRMGTSVIDMYSKCGRVDYARVIFEKDLLDRSLVSWNTLLVGYSQNGYDHEAVGLFHQMLLDSSVKPDLITMANLIPSYASIMDLRMTQSIHGFIIKSGFELFKDVVLGTAMVDAYGKCSDIEAANFMFSFIVEPNAATWNALISGFTLNGQAAYCMKLFLEMIHTKAKPESVTLVSLLQSCGESGSLEQGMLVHGYSIKIGFALYLIVSNATIDMYMRCGSVISSQKHFNSMSTKNIVTWNTMLGGFIKNGVPMIALHLFHQMRLENHHTPDAVTMISAIQASANLSAQGETMHCLVLKIGLNFNILVANSLSDAYSKCGSIDKARSLFEQMGSLRDQSSWNVIISGCGINGQGEEACSLFTQMEEEGHKPNSITFVSLLSACSHAGMISKGCKYFDLMIKTYKIQPGLEHYTCMIDMFGRAGRLEEAYNLIERMPASLVCDGAWGALLSACRLNMNVELGELVGKKLLKLAPENCGYYTTLSNVYALGERWGESAKVRRVFEEGRLMKKPGWSAVKE